MSVTRQLVLVDVVPIGTAGSAVCANHVSANHVSAITGPFVASGTYDSSGLIASSCALCGRQLLGRVEEREVITVEEAARRLRARYAPGYREEVKLN